MLISLKKNFETVFVYFCFQLSYSPTALLKLLIIIQLYKFTIRKILLEDVQHVQQAAFFAVFVGRSQLDG